MLISNLPVLLAERNLKIAKVSRETGISRTTLTALTQGHAQGVQLDTLNTLCVYLKATPSDIFSVLPFDIFIKAVWMELDDEDEFMPNLDFCSGSFILDVIDNGVSTQTVIVSHGRRAQEDVEVLYIELSFEDNEAASIKVLKKYYKKLPIPFRRALVKRIEYQIKEASPVPVDEVRVNEELDQLLMCEEQED